jgi:hypothetical protein
LIQKDFLLFFYRQKEDLARMYRLFSRIPKGLEPVADAFKKHVEADGMALVKEATEAAAAKAAAGKLTCCTCMSACCFEAELYSVRAPQPVWRHHTSFPSCCT